MGEEQQIKLRKMETYQVRARSLYTIYIYTYTIVS